MYYPIGWHKVLNLDTKCDHEHCNIISIQANQERELFFILTTKSIHLWNPRPPVEIACHRRSNDSIESVGLNKSAVWKTDSSVIVVATDRDQLLFYQVRRRTSNTSATSFLMPGAPESDSIFRLHHDSKKLKHILNRDINQDLLMKTLDADFIPALTIFSFGKLDLSSIGLSCLMSAEEELIIGSRNGDIHGVFWDGNIDDKFPWSLSTELEKGSDYVIELKFSSVLSGFVIVFRSGRVGFMPSTATSKKIDNQHELPTTKEKIESRLSYLIGVDDAVCAEINHKYRLVAIGLKNSHILVCNLGESNTTLVVNHKLQIQNSGFPNSDKLGPVKCLGYSPQSFALATSWEGGDFAIWSIFGSLLFCSKQWQLESQLGILSRPVRISAIEWGREGYNLWLSIVQDESDEQESDDTSTTATEQMSNDNSAPAYGDQVVIISIAHSNLSSNPHMTCSSDSILLIGEDRLYVGQSVPQRAKFDHWFVIDIPQEYLRVIYPLRYATVDRECRNIAIAGIRGFALYSIDSTKWKFSKDPNDNGFSVCGDLIWWKGYLLTSCFNYKTDTFEIRAYPTYDTLDNECCVIQPIAMEIIRMSIFENRLLVLYSDGTLGMFMLNARMRPNFTKPKSTSSRSNSNASDRVNEGDQESSQKSSRSNSVMSISYTPGRSNSMKDIFLQISPIENLVISNLQANAYCISSIALTRLHFKNNRSDDSILLNACGKLFLLEREAPHNMSTPSPTSDLSSNDLNDLSLGSHKSNELDIKVKSAKGLANSVHFASASLKNTIEPSALANVTFKAVSVIATNVEQFWISPEISDASDMSYFKKSLWLYCGGQNNFLQVWLPLLNDKNDPPTDLYVPDRIMLPIKCDIYPLAIRSSAPDVVEPDDAIVLGAESDILYKDCKLFTYFPYSTVKRQCRVYLHRILRELLLNQHLGYYARKIAESCQSLPYFAHCFELLLHEVLEEEATSPVPLPDPMLPQIVRFIKEFPVYLETVVHCARKSELSMWSYLFDERAVGNPRRLFQECLEKHKLNTAASCLIILQSLDRNIVSQRMVKELIKAAKEDLKFNYLVEDLENFLLRAELDYMSVSGSGSPNS